MKYVALDIESTGLDTEKDQVLQIGIVIDDLADPKPLNELPTLNLYVQQDRYEGSAFALQMNNNIMKVLAGVKELPEGAIMTSQKQIEGGVFLDEDGRVVATNNPVLDFFYRNLGTLQDKITVAGKNAAGFDIPMLPKSITNCFDHRVIDVGSIYLEKDDEKVPGLTKCLQRAGVNFAISHDALGDAFSVVECIRYRFQEAEAPECSCK